MRISSSYIQQQSVDTMLAKQKELAETQQKVSTGKRILSPSDDPVAAVKVLYYEREQNIAEQYQQNANVAETKMSLAEGTLDSATNILQRINELAVQALNDSNDAESRSGIAEEIEQLNKELLSLANTKDSNGEYLFSGYQSFTQAFDPTSYAYGGDNGQRSIKVGSNNLVDVTEPGNNIFIADAVNSTAGTTTPQAVFQTIEDFTTALRNNTVDTAPNDKDFLTNMTTALDSVLAARTRFGAGLNTVEEQRSINESSLAGFETSLSQLRDLDYAESISLLNMQTVGLQAAQQAYVKVQGLSLFNYL